MTKKNAIIVLLAAAAFLAASVFAWVKTVYYRGAGVHADAEIVDIETSYFDDDVDHDVTVTFTTADGREITGKLDAYKSSFRVGKTVPVLYIPDDPHDFTYEKNGLLLPLILGGTGVFLAVFGIVGLVGRKRGCDDGTDYRPEDGANGDGPV